MRDIKVYRYIKVYSIQFACCCKIRIKYNLRPCLKSKVCGVMKCFSNDANKVRVG